MAEKVQMHGRERVLRAIWEKRIERWLESGLTAKEFAAELHVRPNSLGYWKAKLRRSAPGSPEVPATHERSPG
jgi:hypothetical protein